MTQLIIDEKRCVGFFRTVTQADRAVRNLLAAGFSKEQLAVICPQDCKDHVTCDMPRAEQPGAHAAATIAEGAAAGAAIGGIAVAATAIVTGGIGALAAIPVLLGGGALAGSFSSLILAEGYKNGVEQFFTDALRDGNVVVGVEVQGTDRSARLAEAESILRQAGAEAPPHP